MDDNESNSGTKAKRELYSGNSFNSIAPAHEHNDGFYMANLWFRRSKIHFSRAVQISPNLFFGEHIANDTSRNSAAVSKRRYVHIEP
ncbi:hypothetical protein J7T55_013399 [Diaporthe amygdali]|uniref:uncharacterized protein n=1 Tax=Phomopsis amygdali TaxID=1214568 RepID=UPI0022FDCD90|nr:uncharacterized protein J7T55_013399 [Diaporthe amygdali]KAJ0119163.1 hypothetical protein J7T55_013399 [Diaporthe amygdali]